ncbi:MAG: hypothetical protein HZA54_18885 [Planctomycetes bacterium]|nr:hypothetical protein [Planctomycetota bacterium]
MGLWYRGVLAGAVVVASLATGGIASAQVEDEVWILNRAGGTNITVIGSASGDTPVIKRSLALGLATPQDCVWSPNGRFFIVTNQGSSTVSVIDTVNLTTVPIGGVASFATAAAPYGVSFDPNGLRFYVSEGDDYGPPGAISGTGFEAFTIDANYPTVGALGVTAFATADIAHAGASAGAVIDNVCTPAGFTPTPTDNNITYHSKSAAPFAAAIDRDTGAAPPITGLTVQSGIQVVPAVLGAAVPVFEGRTNSGILSSTVDETTTHAGIPGNRGFNDVGAGVPTNFDIHSGHLMAIDPLNRWVAMVVGADYIEDLNAGEVATADVERALVDIHPIVNMAVSQTFFDSANAPSLFGGPNAPDDQEVIAITAHPSGNFIYCCVRDVTDSGGGTPGGRIQLIRIPATYGAGGGAVVDARDGTNFVATSGGLLPTGIAFTRDGSRGYVILDNGAGRGFVQTFRCDLTAPVTNAIGEIVSGSLSAAVAIGNKPSAICTRPIAVGVADPPQNTGEQEKSHKCFVGELSEGQGTGPTALAPLVSALALAVLLMGLLANRPR